MRHKYRDDLVDLLVFTLHTHTASLSSFFWLLWALRSSVLFVRTNSVGLLKELVAGSSQVRDLNKHEGTCHNNDPNQNYNQQFDPTTSL